MDAYPAAPTATGSVQVINSPAHLASHPAPAIREIPAQQQAVRVPPRNIESIPKDANTWLGMSLRPITRDLAQASHLPQTYGLLVARVDARSPAAISGLESGDILLALDAQRIADIQDLEAKVREKSHGGSATLAVFRNGAIRQIEVNVRTTPRGAAQSAAVAVQP
jgi:S1-C subfamily serine protease